VIPNSLDVDSICGRLTMQMYVKRFLSTPAAAKNEARCVLEIRGPFSTKEKDEKPNILLHKKHMNINNEFTERMDQSIFDGVFDDTCSYSCDSSFCNEEKEG
jgi:hypothetical protein